jgi:hypothetical protein
MSYWKSMDKLDRLRHFIENDWNDKYAYMTRDIADLLCCDTRIARYYLLKMIDEGHIAQLKYWGKTWYVKAYQIEQFEKFNFIRILK